MRSSEKGDTHASFIIQVHERLAYSSVNHVVLNAIATKKGIVQRCLLSANLKPETFSIQELDGQSQTPLAPICDGPGDRGSEELTACTYFHPALTNERRADLAQNDVQCQLRCIPYI